MSVTAHPIRAVLFDRDGTLVTDVPYNGEPDRVEPVAGARHALAALRQAGLRTALVTNQGGIARGLLTHAQVASVHDRLEELLGPFDAIRYCPHDEHAGCRCRKPRPGLVFEAARALGVSPSACVLVGDTGADVAAALAAGAHPILVPNPVTRSAEIAAAPVVAANLGDAVTLVLGGLPGGPPAPAGLHR